MMNHLISNMHPIQNLKRQCKRLILGLLTLLLSAQAFAIEPVLSELNDSLNPPQMVGSGTLKYFGFKIYDAYFYANDEQALDGFALRLDYALKIRSSDLLRFTMKNLRQVGAPEASLPKWEKELIELFPDVESGHRITAIYSLDGSTSFFHNGKKIGKIVDAMFARYFFGIWFDPHTSSPTLRRKLLGAHCAPRIISTNCER